MIMPQRRYVLVLIFILVLSLAAGLYAGGQRYLREIKCRQIEVAMLYEDIKTLAELTGKKPAQVMQLFKQNGLTTVFLKEATLEERKANAEIMEIDSSTPFITAEFAFLTAQGLQQIIEQEGPCAPWLRELAAVSPYNSGVYFITHREDTLLQLAGQLKAKTKVARTFFLKDGYSAVYTPASFATLRGMGLGFSQTALQEIAQAGLLTAIQLKNWPDATPEGLRAVFTPLKKIPHLSALFFNDEILPAYPAYIKSLAALITELDVPVGQIEFFPQKGLAKLGILLDKKVVRMHSISPKEMANPNYNFTQAKDRYVLAAAERNVRFLLVRPFLRPDNGGAGDRILTANLNFYAGLKQALENEKLRLGQASMFSSLPVVRWLLFLMGLGVIAGGLLLWEKIKLPRRAGLILGVLTVLGWLFLLYFNLNFGRKAMALAAVIIFPVLSLAQNVPSQGVSPLEGVWRLIRTSLMSLPGAILTVGLLADTGYMLKLDVFSGVKAAHILPLLILTIVFYFCFIPSSVPGGLRLKKFFDAALPVKWAIIGLILLSLGIIYILRTGNEAVLITSSLELKTRALLDLVLGVRPRTKEFLLGYPLLLLLFYTGYRDHRFLPLLLLGAIGQISLVNTYAHIHTPLLISLQRSFNGLWLGILSGLGLIFIFYFVRQWGQKYFTEERNSFF